MGGAGAPVVALGAGSVVVVVGSGGNVGRGGFWTPWVVAGSGVGSDPTVTGDGLGSWPVEGDAVKAGRVSTVVPTSAVAVGLNVGSSDGLGLVPASVVAGMFSPDVPVDATIVDVGDSGGTVGLGDGATAVVCGGW